MLRAAAFAYLGFLCLGWVALPVPADALEQVELFLGPWAVLWRRFGLGGYLGYAGWVFLALAVVSARDLLLWPFRNLYWFRRVLGNRIFGGARWATRRDLRKAGLAQEGGLFLGRSRGVDLFHRGEGHLITIASAGGGKSSGLVVPSLCLLTEGSVVVTDPSGELAAMTARRRAEIGPVVFLNPFASVFSQETGLAFGDDGFNPFSMLDVKSPNFISDVGAFARLLLVTDRRESGSYWNTEAAAFMSLMIASVKLYDAPDLHNLPFLYSVVRDRAENIVTRLEWIEGEGNPALKDDATRFIDIITHAKPQWAGVISKVALSTDRYAPTTPLGEHVKKDGFDVRRLKREKVTVYVLVPSAMLPIALPWMNLLIGLFSKAISQPGPAAPVTLLIDEAPALGYLPDLRSSMAQYRKAGLRVWLFSQTYAALASPEMYGPDGMKELLGLTLIKQFFSVEEPEVQELVSRLAGQKSISNPSTSGTMGDVGQPLIRSDEVRGLKKWRQILFRGGMQATIRGELVPYFRRKDWSAMVDPNPYIKR